MKKIFCAVVLVAICGSDAFGITGLNIDQQDRAMRSVGLAQTIDLSGGMNGCDISRLCHQSDQIKLALEAIGSVEWQEGEEKDDFSSVKMRLDGVLEARRALFVEREKLNAVIGHLVREF